jgi:hypothetical protein
VEDAGANGSSADEAPPPEAPTATRPDSSSGSVDAGAAPDGGAARVGPCSLEVSVTTRAVGGKYAPDNIGAIWIADANDKFVKTLDVWASRRIEHLARWGSVTTSAGAPSNTVDAITGATEQAHGVRTATWNCTDYHKKPSPDGAYRVCFELTDSNTGGPVDCVKFDKSTSPLRIAPPDPSTFKKRSIVFTP